MTVTDGVNGFTNFLILAMAVPSLAFTFLQTYNGVRPHSISKEQFLAAPFGDLCPSQNCIDDCHNRTRVFQAVPDRINATIQSYGQPNNTDKVDVTLFGLCTNLHNATELARTKGNDTVKSFFTVDYGVEAVSDPFKQVGLGIATCISDTCGRTRDPVKCGSFCGTTILLNNDTDSFDWNHAMLNCIQKLCRSPYVLPYADQDVLGIGVLLSYCIQAVLLLLSAAGVIASLAWQLWTGQNRKPRIIRKLRGPMDMFLTAQTYFSISAAIAAFALHPSTIDPLNGYALMAVTIVGFLCPVFTLLLLHSHDARSWFATALTFVSWLLNTIIFFLLLHNLSRFDDTVYEDAMNQLFTVPTCSGSSAMSLCLQLTGSNPLENLTKFFERNSWANIRTVPMLWVWTTFALIVLISEQVRKAIRDHRLNKVDEQDMVNTRLGQPQGRPPRSKRATKYLPLGKFIAASVFVGLFSLSFGYGYDMVDRFHNIRVINTHGWSFGQVVAALFWIPVLLDVGHSVFEDEHQAAGDCESDEGLEKKRTPSRNRFAYSPILDTSLTDSGNEDRRLQSSFTAPPSLGPRKRSLQQRQTLRMEEGE